MRSLAARIARTSALALVCAALSRAQARNDWTALHATPGIDQASCVTVDPAGNVFAAGVANADASQSSGSAFIAAWSATGAPLWSTNFDASLGGAEFPNAIEFDGAGGLYVAGRAANSIQSQARRFLLHLDGLGLITWSSEGAVTGTPAWSPALLVDASGRAIVGGRTPSGTGDVSIAAYTQAGALAWEATHGAPYAGPDSIVDLALAPNGDIVAAATWSVTSGPHPALIRVSPSGAISHAVQASHPDVASGQASAIAVDAGGRAYLAASAQRAGEFVPRLALIAFDATGGELWTRTITGPTQSFGGGASAVDVAIDAFGRALVLGGRAQGSQSVAALVAAYDAAGTLIWSRIVNDVLGGATTHFSNLASRLLVAQSGEAIAIGTYLPALSDTAADAFALGIDPQGEVRFGIAYGFSSAPGASFDRGSAGSLAPGGGFVIAGAAQTSSAALGFDAFVARFTRTAIGFCYGDGGGSACPCGNSSAPIEEAGCANSLGSGARLADLGASSLSNDTLVLVGSSLPNANALYFQGTSALVGASFGDGLRCAGGTVIRLGVKLGVGGASRYPGAGDLSVSARGLVSVPGPRVYQAWYRNAANFCTSATFNLTNGLNVDWTL